MASVNNNNSFTQTATPAGEATAIVNPEGKSSGQKTRNNKAQGEGRNPRGKQDRQHKKDAKVCIYCKKLGHESDGCYKKASDERVNEAVDVAIRTAKALSTVSPALAAPVAAPAALAEAAPVAEGPIEDNEDDAGWYDAPEDIVDVVGIGAADDGEFEDAEFDPRHVTSRLGYLRLLACDIALFFRLYFAWLWSICGALFRGARSGAAACVARIAESRKSSVFSPLVNSWSDVKLKKLSYGDDDPFLQVFRSLTYMMRVLFFVAIVPYFMYGAWTYYQLAKGTDHVVTEGTLWYCDKPYTPLDLFRMRTSPERAAVETAIGVSNWLDNLRVSEHFLFGGSTIEREHVEPVRPHWQVTSREDRIFRMINPTDDDFCGWVPMMFLTYAKLVTYGMVCLIALMYVAIVRYNFPVHYRPDSIRYVLVGPHEDYNRLSSLGDCRDPGFRSSKSDSVDFVKDPDYLIYDLVETINNVVHRRRVVISNAIFDKLNNPINTMRWSRAADFGKMEQDTLAFARAALQCVNISTSIEKVEQMTFETAKLFCYLMRSKRVFSTNFGTPGIE